jgi:hypothetical protein
MKQVKTGPDTEKSGHAAFKAAQNYGKGATVKETRLPKGGCPKGSKATKGY